MLLEVFGILALIYVCPALVPRQHPLRFYLCYLAYVVHGSFIPTVFIPLQLISLRLYSVVVLSLASLGCKILRIEWDIRQRHLYEKCKGGIVIANHQSVFDVIGLLIVNNGFIGISGIAKKELRYILPVAIFFWKLGIIFIDRSNSKEALKAISLAVSKNKDKKIIIFPEGTRNQKGDGLLPFKRGAFKTAIDHHIPIIPLVFSPYTFIKPMSKFDGGKVIISCLEPIQTDGMQQGDTEVLMEKTRQLMQTEYYKISAELGRDNNNQ